MQQSYAEWLQGMFSVPWALTSVAALLLSSWLFGRLLLDNLLKLRLRHAPLEHLAAIAAGLNVWALLAFAAGHLRLLNAFSARVALLVSAAAALVWLAYGLRDGGLERLWSFVKSSKWLLLTLFALFAMNLGNDLCPPAGNVIDEQAYHIPVPMRWESDGFPYVYKDIAYSGYPLLSGFVFWLTIAAGKASSPRVLCMILCLLSMACLYFLFRSRVRSKAASLILAGSLTLPWTPVVFMLETFAEPMLLFSFLCGIAVFERAKPGFRWSLALGLFAGACLGLKLTGFAPAAVLGLAVLFKKGTRPQWPKLLAGFSAACALVAAPFYLRPLLQTGNPFYPYYAWLFTDNLATIAMSRHLHYLGGPSLYGYKDWLHGLLSPVLLSFDMHSYEGYWGWHVVFAFIGCLAAMALALRRSGSRRTLFCGVGFLLLYAFWLYTSQQARFLGPALCLMMLGAVVLLPRFNKWIRRACLLAIIVSTFWWIWGGLPFYYVNCWRMLLQDAAPDRYMAFVWKDGLCDAFRALQRSAPPDAKVMLVFEKRVLGCPRTTLVASPLYQELYFTPPPTGTPEEIDAAVMREIESNGVSYVLLATKLGKAFTQPEMQEVSSSLTDSFARLVQARKLRIVKSNDTHALLEVVAKPQALRRSL